MTQFLCRWLALAVLLVLVGAHTGAVNAAWAGTSTYNLSLFAQEQVFSGPNNKESFWFEIKPEIKLEGNCFLDLWYSHSETILTDQSVMTVMFNGTPVASRRLSDRDVQKTNWRIALPIDKMQEGFNEISITTSQRTIEGDCRDIDNDANWLVLHENTVLHLETSGPPDLRLKHYPYPFLNYLSGQPVNCIWYLPEKPGHEEIQTMLQLASDWGRRLPFKSLPIKVSTKNPADSTGNQILIGEIKKWPGLHNPDIPTGLGILSLSSRDTGERLLISGTEAPGLARAQSLLTQQEMVKQADNKLYLVKNDPPGETTPKTTGRPGLYTFAELGYPEITLEGAFHQRTLVTIQRPQERKVGIGSYVEIRFHHSKLLQPDQSGLTVYINGRAVTSTVLNNGNAEKGVLKATIPVEELDKREWQIELALYHDLGKVDCSKRYDELAWSVIEGTSNIYLAPGKIEDYSSLEEFPYAYGVHEESRQHVTMWLSPNPTEQELSLAAVIAARMGQNSMVPVKWHLVMDEQLDKEKVPTSTVIMIGYQHQGKRLASLKGTLPVWPEGRGGFVVAPNLNISAEVLRESALLQAVNYAFKEQGALYTVLGANDRALERVAEVLVDPSLAKKVQGQVTIISNQGKIDALTTVKADNGKLEEVIAAPLQKNWVIYAAMMGLMVVVIGITIWISYKRSR